MFNEESSVERCVDRVIREIKKRQEKMFLIAVNDGSRDSTLSILLKKRKQYNKYLRVVSHRQNKGYGKSLMRGIKTATQLRCDYVLFMDSDLTNNPSYIPLFLEKAYAGYDCIKASRYVRGGGMRGVSLRRMLISKLGNTIAFYLFRIGIHDCTNGFRMVRLSKLKDINFKESSFPIILEELYQLKKSHSSFTEIPIMLTSRAKKSLSHFRYNIKVFSSYGKYAVKALFV